MTWPLAVKLALPATALLGAVAGARWAAGRLRRRLLIPHKPAERTPADVGLPWEDLTMTRPDGVTIAAWHVPGATGRTLLVLHGMGGERSSMLDIAARLHHHGYGVCLPDMRGHGASGEAVCTFGLRESADMSALLDLLTARGDVDPEALGVYGVSMGGAVALLTAARDPRLKVVVADSAYARLTDILQRRRHTGLYGLLTPIRRRLIQRASGFRMGEVDVPLAVTVMPVRPVLLIHGELDPIVPVGQIELLWEALSHPKDRWVVEGVGHVEAFLPDPAEYERRVIGWLDGAFGVTRDEVAAEGAG
ncbi:MAG: alpha/beta fold hydrolase [Chloroflexi bacterium]|nr:alpha/beta fold hydrolase [Chloroflexota bacterium]